MAPRLIEETDDTRVYVLQESPELAVERRRRDEEEDREFRLSDSQEDLIDAAQRSAENSLGY